MSDESVICLPSPVQHLCLANLEKLVSRIESGDLTLSEFESLRDAILFQFDSLSPVHREVLLNRLDVLAHELGKQSSPAR